MNSKKDNKGFKYYIQRLLNYLPSKKILILLIILNIISILFGIIVPMISAKLIVSFSSNILDNIILIIIVLTVIRILDIINSNIINYIQSIETSKIIVNLKKDLATEILKLDTNTITDKGSGHLYQRLNNDTGSLIWASSSLMNNLRDIFIIIGTLIAILFVNIKFFIVVLIYVIIDVIIEKLFTDKNTKLSKEYEEDTDSVVGLESELARGIQDIKMLNAEHSFLKLLNKKLKNNTNKDYDMNNYLSKIRSIISLFDNTTNILIILFLISLILDKKLSVSFALVLFNYFKTIYYSTPGFAMISKNISKIITYSDRIFEIIDSDSSYHKESFGNIHLDKVIGDFEFRNVYFHYNDSKEVLKGLSFKIPHDKTIGFVGASGVGKTTIFNLLCKMYDVDSGEILIDNHNIKDLDRESIRGNITVISQDPYIFNLSIKDNFKLIKDNVTDEEIRNACKLACLDDYIESLPDKYDTILGEDGITLSGGQKQRLAIARALVQKTEIILFDEATSALDNITQKQIQTAIDNLQGNYTIMIIAHRLSTIKNCDNIYYLEDGKVSLSGTHEYLLKHSKGYRTLYNEEIEK